MRLAAALMCACAVFTWIRPSGAVRARRVLDGLARVSPVSPSRMRTTGVSHAMQGPLVADLLGAAIEAGLPLASATDVVHRALVGPVRDEVGTVIRAYEVGASVDEAWRRLPADSILAPVVQAVTRSYESGAALSPVLRACADDMRRDHRARAEIAARTAGVRAIGPLAACFLPAFLLMGVLPVIASMAAEVFGP